MTLHCPATPPRPGPTALLDHARDYARSGLTVIPVRPDAKRPPPKFRWKRYQEEAPHEAAIIHWFGTLYPDAQIGIVCREGLVCIDVDPRNGGHESIEGFPIPRTPTVDSGGGGKHYWLSASLPLGSHKLLTGVDFLAQGSYLIAPPSRHCKTGKPYAWAPGLSLTDVPIAPLPDWALERVLVLESLRDLAQDAIPLPAEIAACLTDAPICIKALEAGR